MQLSIRAKKNYTHTFLQATRYKQRAKQFQSNPVG